MNQIPTEIWYEIFIKLTLEDKLKCMLVCRSWYNTLDRHSLLHTLDIHGFRFPKLHQMIEGLPHRANQVEHLTLQSSYFFPDKRIVFNMFPNLREIILPSRDYSGGRSFLDSPFHFTHPASKLEKITEFYECELTRQLARSKMCNSLKILELSFTSQLESSSPILSQLKNMPVLEILRLRESKIKLMDLETLHRNLPSIKSLSLHRLHILYGYFPQDIVPASLLTEIEMYLIEVDDKNTHIQFYKYISNKYPSVKKPICDDKIVDHNSILLDGRMDYPRDVYNEGTIPFYQKIGSQLDTFEFKRYCDGLDAFNKFDQAGMKLKTLTIQQGQNDNIPFLQEIVQSRQSKYIQKLTLRNSFPTPLDMMMNMDALTTLEMNFDDSYSGTGNRDKATINFSQLVDVSPPTLTHLRLNNVYLDFNESTSNVTSIQSLELTHVNISTPETILGTSFPKLTTLCLDAMVTSNLTISLPSIHLKKVSINIEYPKHEPCELDITVMNEGKPQRSVIWPADDKVSKGKLYGSGVPTSGSTGMTMVEFTCASIEELSYEIAEQEDDSDDYYDNNNDYYYYGEDDYSD